MSICSFVAREKLVLPLTLLLPNLPAIAMNPKYTIGLDYGTNSVRALIVDNATSHVEQMAPFVALVRTDPEFATCLIPVGNGEFLAVKASS